MVDDIREFDLLGDPILPRREGPGRPETVWNKTTSDLVLLSFVRGLTVKRTAQVAGMSTPTLRKVYFAECEKRLIAGLKFEMRQLARLNAKAEAGDTSAERELARRLDQLRLRDRAEAQASAPPSAPRGPRVGKKAEAEQRAAEQRGLYEPPAPPPLLN